MSEPESGPEEVLDDNTVYRYEERMIPTACGHRWVAYLRIPVPAEQDEELTATVEKIIEGHFEMMRLKVCPRCTGEVKIP